MTTRVWLCLPLLAVGLCFLTGCGSGPVKVNGKVVRDGKPFELTDKGMFVMSLMPVDAGDKNTYAVETKTDGTFTVVGPTRNGAPPGKYKVAIEALDPYGKHVDKLGGKFVSSKTNLTVEVKAGQDLVVDVGK